MATDLGTLLIRVGVRGVQDVTIGLQKVGDAAKESSKSVGVLDIALGTLAGNIAGKVLGGLMSLPGMLFNAGAAAVNLSNQFEGIKVGLEAITGSAAKAEQKMAFIKALAIPSEYTAGQLAEAGMMIEGMGLRMEKVLPLVTKLTMGTRRTGEEYQRMAVGSIFGRLAQGVQPEMQAMSAFGIGRGALAEFGAKFGPNGEMLSTAKEMLDALERLIETRFGRALELAANTGQAKMSALADMWEQSVARLGDALKRLVMPAVDQLAGWFRFMLQGGWIDQFATRLGSAFGIAGDAIKSPMDFVISHLLAVAENLPDMLKTAAQAFSDIMDRVFGKWDAMTKILAGGTLGLRLDRMVQETLPTWMFGADAPPWAKAMLKAVPGIGLFAGARSKREVLADFDAEIKRREDMLTQPAFMAAITEALAPGSKTTDYGAIVKSRAAQLFLQMRALPASATVVPGDPDPSAGWGKLAAPIADTATATRATAKHTREMADAFRDLRGTMFGGGQRTRGAVSSIEAQIALARALGMGIG